MFNAIPTDIRILATCEIFFADAVVHFPEHLVLFCTLLAFAVVQLPLTSTDSPANPHADTARICSKSYQKKLINND